MFEHQCGICHDFLMKRELGVFLRNRCGHLYHLSCAIKARKGKQNCLQCRKTRTSVSFKRGKVLTPRLKEGERQYLGVLRKNGKISSKKPFSLREDLLDEFRAAVKVCVDEELQILDRLAELCQNSAIKEELLQYTESRVSILNYMIKTYKI